MNVDILNLDGILRVKRRSKIKSLTTDDTVGEKYVNDITMCDSVTASVACG